MFAGLDLPWNMGRDEYIHTHTHKWAQFPWLQQTSPSLCQLRIQVTVCYHGIRSTQTEFLHAEKNELVFLLSWSHSVRLMRGFMGHEDKDSHISLSKKNTTEKTSQNNWAGSGSLPDIKVLRQSCCVAAGTPSGKLSTFCCMLRLLDSSCVSSNIYLHLHLF